MLDLEYVNANSDSIEFTSAAPWIMTNVTGLHAKPINVQQKRGFAQNGAYYYGSLDDPRIINISAIFKGANINEIRQKEAILSNIFNPRLGLGELRIDTGGTKKFKIAAAVSVQPDPYKIEDSIYLARAFDVILFCPKPDILSFLSTQERLEGTSGGLTIPFTIPFTLGSKGAGGTINYTGDNPAQLMLDFRVVSGGATVINPVITKNTGEYIKLETTITAGQRILIDTNPDSPSIKKVDVDDSVSDAWETRVQGSTFFQLDVGDNIFTFTSDSGNPEVYLTWNEQYSGIKYL